jgi:hypothetical protein
VLVAAKAKDSNSKLIITIVASLLLSLAPRQPLSQPKHSLVDYGLASLRDEDTRTCRPLTTRQRQARRMLFAFRPAANSRLLKIE